MCRGQAGVADLLQDGPRTTTELARQLGVNESALYRILRALASRGIFQETSPRTFANTTQSGYLRTEVPGSVRSLLIFWGPGCYYGSFGQILHSIHTGQSGRSKLFGMDGWDYLRQRPEVARTFEDAMTDISSLLGPSIAGAYDFGQWGSVMDVGGGNGILLAPSSGRTSACAVGWRTCRTCSNAQRNAATLIVNWKRAARCNRATSFAKCRRDAGHTYSNMLSTTGTTNVPSRFSPTAGARGAIRRSAAACGMGLVGRQ